MFRVEGLGPKPGRCPGLYDTQLQVVGVFNTASEQSRTNYLVKERILAESRGARRRLLNHGHVTRGSGGTSAPPPPRAKQS